MLFVMNVIMILIMIASEPGLRDEGVSLSQLKLL